MTITPTLWLGEQQANTTDVGAPGDDQNGQQIVGLANGNFVVLWESNTDGGPDGSAAGTDIIGQLYDAEGNKIGGEFRANQGFFVDDEGDFTAAALPNGNFVVAYEDTDGAGTSLRFNVLDPNGVAITTGTIQNDPGAADLGDPSITVRPDGSFLVAYQSRDIAANQTDTFAVIVDAGGVIGAPFLLLDGSLSTDVGANGHQVDAATLTNGNYVIVARQIAGDNGFNMRIVNSTGGNVLGFTEVSGTIGDGDSDVAPSVAALSGGGFVVAWQNTDVNDTDVIFQLYNAAGAAVGGQVNVNSGGATDFNATPEVIGLSDGGFVIVYRDNEGGSANRLQRFDANGVTVGTEVTLSTGAFNGGPTVTLSDDGRLLVGWSQSVFTGGVNFDEDVEFSILDPRVSPITGDGTAEQITSRQDGADVSGLGGADTLFGQNANDTLRGGDGDDLILGRGGADLIEGGLNGDTVDGGSGNDNIFANTELDPNGSAVGDSLDGGADSDTLTGSGGVDTMIGGTADDTFQYFAGQVADGEILDGGAGSDRILALGDLNLSNATLTSIDEIEFSAANGDPKAVTIQAIQVGAGISATLVIDGNFSSAQDRFRIEMGADTSVNLSGFTFQDFDPLDPNELDRFIVLGDNDAEAVVGTSIRDELFGTGGNDTLGGGAGGDYLSGGADSDTATYSQAAAGVTASLTNAAGNTGEAAGDTYNSIENFTGSTFGDTLEGNAGANTIRSGGGQDVVTGGAGSDSLLGGEANDTLNGGVGGDTLNGGAGSDLATYQDAAAGVVASLANIAINTGEAAGDVYTSIERLTGSDFADSLNGANVVLNTLRGGLGNDTLKGATGNDFLEGGGDDDTFVFNTALNAATNVDTILDFTQADDTIHLDQTFFSQIVLGALAGSAFKNLSAAAVDAGDRILYDPGTGEIFYDANGSVAGQRTLFAKVDPGTLLNHTDFFVTP